MYDIYASSTSDNLPWKPQMEFPQNREADWILESAQRTHVLENGPTCAGSCELECALS